MERDRDWTYKEKLVARVISWGIIISVVIIIMGAISLGLEILISGTTPSFAWFTNATWEFQVLIIGGLIVGIIIGVIVFTIFIRRGQRFILNLLFKIKK